MGRFECWDSPEQQEAYKKVDLTWEKSTWDEAYETFMQKIRKDKNARTELQIMKRLVLKDESEWLLYSETTVGKDQLGNPHRFFRGSLGKILQPIPHRSIKVNTETGEHETVTDGILGSEIKYIFPFDKEKVKALYEKSGIQETAFVIQVGESGTRVTVDNFSDFLNVEYKYLKRFGHKPSDYEKTLFSQEQQGQYQHYQPPANPGPQYH